MWPRPSLCAGLVTEAAHGKKEGNPCIADEGPQLREGGPMPQEGMDTPVTGSERV